MTVNGTAFTEKESLSPCTTIMVGKDATIDGSVMFANSCDGNQYGLIYIIPAKSYYEGTKLPMYVNYPKPETYEECLKQVEEGYDLVGYLPVKETYRSIMVGGYLTNIVDGGMNEYGVTMGIEFLSMKPELVNNYGVVSPNSNHWTTSLIANGLMRAKTAREAILIMGSMAEEYGFRYYWTPTGGCMIPIADKNEAWMMEIMGPGKDWTPSCGRPGAVWCAQRIPDDKVGCNANRSRIDIVDLDNSNYFMSSSNIYSVAEELGLWTQGDPFIWYEVYGVPGSVNNSMREWACLNLVAPSLGLYPTEDPTVDRFPFSVKPDKPLKMQNLINIMRDYYKGTKFDITKNPAFYIDGEKSPLARPWGSLELFNLLGTKPQRCIGTESTSYVIAVQIRNWLPDPVTGCMWFAFGPSYTSCFVPIYSGVTALPSSWDCIADFIKINREQTQWKFQLVHNLSYIKYQDAIEDIKAVYEPAETHFFALQPDFESAAVNIFNSNPKNGRMRTEKFITEYVDSCLKKVDDAYGELVNYLEFKYLFSYWKTAPQKLPIVEKSEIPDAALDVS